MEYATKATNVEIKTVFNRMNERDAQDDREGRYGVIKELQFQSMPFASV